MQAIVGIALHWFLYINGCGCSSLFGSLAVVTEKGTNEMTNKPKKTRAEREAEKVAPGTIWSLAETAETCSWAAAEPTD